jgi:hypothetical protein
MEARMNSNRRHVPGGTLALVLTSAIALSGCGKNETHSLEKAGAAADKAIEKAKDATAEAAKSVSEAAEKAKDSAAAAATSVSQAADKAVDATREAADKAVAATKDAAASAAKATSTAVAPRK